jgi:hypothetical protein
MEVGVKKYGPAAAIFILVVVMMLVVAGRVWDPKTAIQLLPIVLPVAGLFTYFISRWLKISTGDGD